MNIFPLLKFWIEWWQLGQTSSFYPLTCSYNQRLHDRTQEPQWGCLSEWGLSGSTFLGGWLRFWRLPHGSDPQVQGQWSVYTGWRSQRWYPDHRCYSMQWPEEKIHLQLQVSRGWGYLFILLALITFLEAGKKWLENWQSLFLLLRYWIAIITGKIKWNVLSINRRICFHYNLHFESWNHKGLCDDSPPFLLHSSLSIFCTWDMFW